MSKGKWVMLVVLLSFLCIAALGPGPVRAQTIHENPANLTVQQPFDVSEKLAIQLNEMFGSLDNIALQINANDFKASRLSMSDFERYYASFQRDLGRMNLTGSDYQQILSHANLTADDLRAMINGSEAFNASLASFDKYRENGDTVNATIEAVELQGYFGTMNNSSRQLTASASAISRLLQNTSVSTSHLDGGIDMLNVFMDRVEGLNEVPKSLLGNTNLTLNASLANVSTGDMVMFYGRLSSNNTTIGGGLVSLYVDGVPVANATTLADGTCVIYYIIRGGSFAGTLNALAYYDPQGANYTPAVSNNVELKRRPITTYLTIAMAPGTARYGDTVRLSGMLTADGGYPVPDYPVSVHIPDRPACIVRTLDNGSYYCDLYITPQIRSGQFDLVAMYEAGNMPGDVLINATSLPATLSVIRETTSLSLDKAPSVLRGGDNAYFSGTLLSASGRPVEGEEVSIYAGTVRLGGGNTDARGRYNLSIAIPCNLTAGTYQAYAAYSPPDGMCLSGTQSNPYAIIFTTAPPAITVYGLPLVLFQGDKLDLLVNVTANGLPVDGCGLIVNLSAMALGSGRTDYTGNLYLINTIDGSAGLQSVKVCSAASGLLEATTVDTRMVLVMPFDMMTSLAVIGVILVVIGLVLARVTRASRLLARLLPARKTPLPRPTLKVTPLPETSRKQQPPVSRFEDEITRINGIIAGGAGRREIITEIYLAARRITANGGIAIPESATHREFFKSLTAKEPSLVTSAGTITKNYESAVFGRIQLKEQDIVNSLYNLKEINAHMLGEGKGEGA
ncbi:MAG TPA: carboxypeptidase-like regulatory domain-containing protein [Methanocella sp.]|jgi:hypothetical protein